MITPALLLLQDAELPEAFQRTPEMTTGSTVMLAAAWTFVIVLLIWSFKRVLGGGPEPS